MRGGVAAAGGRGSAARTLRRWALPAPAGARLGEWPTKRHDLRPSGPARYTGADKAAA